MKIVDLSQAFYVGLRAYDAAWYPKFQINQVMSPGEDPNGTTRTFTQHLIFPHNSTHIESARHFFPDGLPIADVPLETLVGEAVVADLSHKRPLEPVTARDLEESAGDILRPGDRLLIRTDYVNQRWDREDFWEKPPYLTPDAAEWMVERQVALVGIDFLTERPGDGESPVHTILLRHNIPIAEYLRNMDRLTSRRVFLVALPVLVRDVEASAARIVAIEGMNGA